MKRNYLILMMLSALASARAQYLDFPDTGAVWNISTAYYDGWPPSNQFNYEYYTNGTQVIGGKTYNRISGTGGNYFCCHRYVRTDTVAGKVYWLRDSTELLLFDYSLGVGDT